MRYLEFKKTFIKTPIILSKDLRRLKKDGQVILNRLNRWRQKGLIIRLKKGAYLLSGQERKIDPSRFFLAGQLYGPSYVSVESALSFYGLIPEKVADMTSVTTKKTAAFKNELGSFIYQHIKPDVFRGFKTAKDSAGLTFFIAEPEKAIIDFLYLNLEKIPADSKDIFKESFRFQNMEKLRPAKIVRFLRLFDSKKLRKVVKNLCDVIKEEGGR